MACLNARWYSNMHNFKPLLLTVLFVVLIVAAGIGFMFGLTNPVSWILILILIAIPFLYNRKVQSDHLAWDDSCSVGIKSIDDEHRKLIGLINKFDTAYKYHISEEYERNALAELVEYTKHHFDSEEALMQKYGYPDFESHKQQHVEMIAKVNSLIEEYETKGSDALGGVIALLKDWLVNHIKGTDKQYTAFLNQKGVN